MTLGEFIKSYRDSHNNLSQRAFASRCGLSNGYISMLEKGYNPKTGEPIKPTLAKIKLLASGMDMSAMELMTTVDEIEIDISYPDNIIPLPLTGKKIPVLGDIACGEPILASENFAGEIDLPEGVNASFALRCKGDSMIDARILDGDYVFIREQPDVENGEIAAVLIGEEATLKRVYKNGDQLVLMAANARYQPFTYTGDQINNVRILGKAVWFLSRVQ